MTNIVAWSLEPDEQYFVRSNLLLLRSRWDSPTFDIVSCRRDDLIRLSEAPRLARRTIYLDQATLGTPNLAMFL